MHFWIYNWTFEQPEVQILSIRMDSFSHSTDRPLLDEPVSLFIHFRKLGLQIQNFKLSNHILSCKSLNNIKTVRFTMTTNGYLELQEDSTSFESYD